MMPNGGPAFPNPPKLVPEIVPDEFTNSLIQQPGMTLRDYFAAAALQGLIACQDSDDRAQQWLENFAVSSAYALADAMLKERDK